MSDQEPLLGLNEYQKTQVRNISVAMVIPGGVLVSIIAMIMGYFSAQVLPHQVVKDARDATKNANEALIELNTKSQNLENNHWPEAIICQRSTESISTVYRDLVFWFAHPRSDGGALYRHSNPDLHFDIMFNRDQRLLPIKETDEKRSHLELTGLCYEGVTVQDLRVAWRAFGRIPNFSSIILGDADEESE